MSAAFLNLACHGFYKQFIHEIIKKLPESLNVTVTSAEKVQVAVIELDGQWSYGENEDNQQ
ncbi:hypothetical protein DB44_CJ00100 [Candidatus Protochlamydia amoebophila]|uniref:Uncharacterized protein n=1 Tax=Candidatus Protochlamydia amoebophila TaxID=362787 RepID=A0A0C1JPD4_9BACT|nr:hypothetical protein [Candidatus Protochlamydia amoebophila]KIC72396.1 hypothetical protein DB44_CJ00100 [Candidatus Protochlamydia amoebophila]